MTDYTGFMVKPYTDDIRIHTSGIRTACECTQMIYELIGLTYKGHTNGIRVHTIDI